MFRTSLDAVVVGAGPNGLAAAAVLARAGLSVAVLEGQKRLGGGSRTEALTLPGYSHDVCGAIHPMGVVSPVFRLLDLHAHGLQWIAAPLPLAHPFDDGRTATLHRDLSAMGAGIGAIDGARWGRLMTPFVRQSAAFFQDILRPIRWPAHPLLMARFGRHALRSADGLVRRFEGEAARALFGGCAAHSFLPLGAAGSASFGLALAVAAHAIDWPVARGGSQAIVEALASVARANGCTIHVDHPVRSLADVPASRVVLFDLTPRQLEQVAGSHLAHGYRRRLRDFRYGPGAFKIDYALSGPIPWRSPECAGAATVHLGGTYLEIARAEDDVTHGRVPEQPFVLVAQQSAVDPSRAPAGCHTGWAYCHVPHGCDVDVTARVEAQLERFAPGFRDLVLARHVMRPRDFEAHNPNMVGGDIGGGSNVLRQFLFRPFPRWNPYTTSNPRLFLCSSSTPPGGGVHGMCGYWAARTVLDALGCRLPAPLRV
ncbi:MAG TPA: NAD(P)/FAD-dependent oxidoreductase [Luteitalea sp.]|nr:NAD(P)/FAD-dependent oxidoreductase [Luteitalea sp.]